MPRLSVRYLSILSFRARHPEQRCVRQGGEVECANVFSTPPCPITWLSILGLCSTHRPPCMHASNTCAPCRVPVLQAEYEREEIDWSYIQVSRHGLCFELCAQSPNSSPTPVACRWLSVLVGLRLSIHACEIRCCKALPLDHSSCVLIIDDQAKGKPSIVSARVCRSCTRSCEWSCESCCAFPFADSCQELHQCYPERGAVMSLR